VLLSGVIAGSVVLTPLAILGRCAARGNISLIDSESGLRGQTTRDDARRSRNARLRPLSSPPHASTAAGYPVTS
jgi:hypothetical protein